MNKPPETEDTDSEPLNELDGQIRSALEATGAVIPTTVEAVVAADRRLTQDAVPLPAHLQDGAAVLARDVSSRRHVSPENLVPFVSAYNEAVEADLARAARKGGEISPAVEEKMRRARERVQHQKRSG
jgi:hypothetical protein